MRIYITIICFVLILSQAYAKKIATNPGSPNSAVAGPLQEGPWFFIHPQNTVSPLLFDLKGTNQINVENIAVFNGIVNNQKVARISLNKGVHIANSAVFATSKIQTSRGPLAINSAIHFLNGSVYQFRKAENEQTTSWEHLSGTNMTGTLEIEPGSDKHINGYISYEGSGKFTFPVGNGNGQFYPLTVDGNTGQTITTAWISGDPSQSLDSTDSQPAHNRASLTGNVKSVYPNGQWDWHIRNAGVALSGENAPANVTPVSPIAISITIPTDIDLINGNSTNLRLVGWNGGAWEEISNSSISPGILSASVNRTYSAITIGTVDQGALPVKLVAFAVKQEETATVLTWETAEEKDSESFEIERSPNGNDWIKLGSIIANGNSESASQYQYVDMKPLLGRNFYRLKMNDLDKTYAYSSIKTVSFTGVNEIIIYPNPVSDQLKIQTDFDWKLVKSVKLYNQTGKPMYVSSNTPEKSILVKDFPVGNYFLSLEKTDGSIKQFTIVIYH
jgi:hypothetical protein